MFATLVCHDELLWEVLSRVPVKSLMCCKCVCKNWLSLIEERDRGLIDLHLSRSKETHPSLLITCVKEGCGTNFFIVDDLFQQGGGGGGEAVHLFETPWTNAMISYSLNGLLCILEGGFVRIFNPTTRQVTPPIETIYYKEPQVENDIVAIWVPRYGFGCDRNAMEHKVVCLWQIWRFTKADRRDIGYERIGEVMTVGENKWRRIDAIPPPYNIRGDPANVNGSIFWMNTAPHSWEAPDCNAIVAFDVESEMFSLIKIPNHILGEPQSLMSARGAFLLQVDGCLAMIHRRTGDGKVTLWILDGVKEVIVNDTGKAAASWNETLYTSKWIEETISMPFDDWNGYQHLEFQPIAGTDMIIMKPYQTFRPSPRNSTILYYYDRKKKTSRKVEIAGIYSLMDYPYDYSITTITKSLLPVQDWKQKQYQQQQLAQSNP